MMKKKNKQKSKKKEAEKRPVVKKEGLRLSVPKQKLADGRAKRKRKRSDEDEGENDGEDGKPKAKRKRAPVQKIGVQSLANLLERIWSVLDGHYLAEPFRQPVTLDVAPDYYDIIENPIDLRTIKDKLQKLYYKDVQTFMADLELMRDNCYKYNQSRNQHLLSCVDELISALHQELEKNQAEIRDIESIIEKESKRAKPRQKSTNSIKIKRSKPSKKKKNRTKRRLQNLGCTRTQCRVLT